MRGLYQIAELLTVCALIAQFNCGMYAQTPSNNGPGEQLHSFTPLSGDTLVKGSSLIVSADVSIQPSSLEAITFISTVTINKRRLRPFVTTLTQETPVGEVGGREVMSWNAHVPGPKQLSIRLQLEGVGQTSQSRFQFADITRRYPVSCNPKECWVIHKIQQFLGSCS